MSFWVILRFLGVFVMPQKEEATKSSQILYSRSDNGNRNHKLRLPHQLLREQMNLNPYKSNQAWPGRTYILIGNSFNLEKNVVATTSDTKRSASIAMVLEKGKNNRKCVSVEDAFLHEGFVECLSRFEFDWLKKQPPSTLLGPAYDEHGKLITMAFAVWRRDVDHKEITKALQ